MATKYKSKVLRVKPEAKCIDTFRKSRVRYRVYSGKETLGYGSSSRAAWYDAATSLDTVPN